MLSWNALARRYDRPYGVPDPSYICGWWINNSKWWGYFNFCVLFFRCMLQPVQVNMQPVRTRILFDFKGKPQTAEEVPDRFFRLHNGLWIRTQAGRHKRRWKKQPARVHRLKQHIFCNRTQCQMLDKMVNLEYKVPRHLVNDPYAPYHRKSNLPEYRYSPPKFLPWFYQSNWMKSTIIKISSTSGLF